MICPHCKTEYRPGFARCVDCDVDLVESLAPEASDKLPKALLEVAWRGGDPVAYGRVCDALESASVEFAEVATHDHMVFGMGIPRPRYEIRVRREDLDRALEVLGDIRETIALELSSKKIAEGDLIPESETDKIEK